MSNISYLRAGVSCLPFIGPYYAGIKKMSKKDNWLRPQERRFYSICAVVGNIVSIATLVGLAALKVLNARSPLFKAYGALCTFNVCLFTGMAYLETREIHQKQSKSQ